MYTAFEEKLTVNGKSLVSTYVSKLNVQSVFKEMTKHATSSPEAQLSGETLH
jgi:hypothetical protein